MPLKPLSVAVLVCEKVLHEQDGVASAIRIVDIFPVPENLPQDARMSAQVLCVVRTMPFDETHQLSIRHERPDGTVNEIISQQIAPVGAHPLGPMVPVGLSINLEIGVRTQPLGTHNIHLLIDGEEIARAHFTLVQRIPPAA